MNGKKRQNASDYLFQTGIGDAARDQEADPQGWSEHADGQVDHHDGSQLNHIDSQLRENRRQYGHEQNKSGGRFHECSRHEQQKVDEDQ